MRWKADLPKMPRLPKVPLEAGYPAAGELGPPPAPSAYRAQNPSESQPADYQAPSMLVEHRGLALLFLAAALGFLLYCLKGPHRSVAPDAPQPAAPEAAASAPPAATPGAQAAQAPIYVETLPDKDR
jgi:hypothetical protein